MRKIAAVAVVLLPLLALAACGGGNDSAPNAKEAASSAKKFVPPTTNETTSTTTTTTTTSRGTSSAVELSKQLGCTDPHVSSPSDSVDISIPGLPKPRESVTCPIGQTSVTVDVYASHEDVQKAETPAVLALVCSFAKAFGASDFYYVQGDDFIVTVTREGQANGSKADTQAMADALSLDMKSYHCA